MPTIKIFNGRRWVPSTEYIVGDLNNLKTTAKKNLVDSINEIKDGELNRVRLGSYELRYNSADDSLEISKI